MSTQEGLRWVVAMPSEATALIDAYKLRLVRDHPFKVYANANKTQALVVSGLGRVVSAAATVFLSEYVPSARPMIFINVGIAGARDYPLGSVWRAHKVLCASTGKVWYPGALGPRVCQSANLVTVDKPELGYPDESLFDMEAAGFFEMASKLTSLELIQSLKVVSDNSKEDISGINKAKVTDWIRSGLDSLEAVTKQLENLREAGSATQPPSEWEEKLCERFRFSVTQRHQLNRAFQRYWALAETEQPVIRCMDEAKDGADYLKRFSAFLETMPVMWGER
jgi:adenosylhomocysteine nucleosidase